MINAGVHVTMGFPAASLPWTDAAMKASKNPTLAPAQVSLLGMPDFDYRLSVYHGDLSLVPGLDAWLRTVLGDAIFKCVSAKLPHPLLLPVMFCFHSLRGRLTLKPVWPFGGIRHTAAQVTPCSVSYECRRASWINHEVDSTAFAFAGNCMWRKPLVTLLLDSLPDVPAAGRTSCRTATRVRWRLACRPATCRRAS